METLPGVVVNYESISSFRSDYEGWKPSISRKANKLYVKSNVLEVTMRDGNTLPKRTMILSGSSPWVLEVTMRDGNFKKFTENCRNW